MEVGKSEIKVPADSVSSSQAALSPDGRRGRELSGASLVRGLIPFMRARPIRPNRLQKAPPPKTTILGIRIHHEFGGNKNIPSIAY